ncbi:L,D-transpeptidase family protein [Peribacillus acanthi]|uniref:L,D-transpeptidase family protein n=1 Tax=Peribacillus acanthi TaxID=2171554 RepID=UPI001F0C6E66|nr:L,D-transpeptidase family protein [Peribacillus acanthi]
MSKKWLVAFVILCLAWGLPASFSQAASNPVNQLIIINKQPNLLAYYENGKLSKTFKVATGKKPSYTPEGRFKIVNKIKNRPYYKEKIPGGDPRNPLGKRWLGINARGTWGTTYAIHGNNNSASIGKFVSAGCIRMYNNNIEWLFNRIKTNTPVIITTSKNSFQTIAATNGYKVDGLTSLPVDVVPTKQAITLKIGSKGSAVKSLQARLTVLGYEINRIDSIFGKETLSAVKQFQKANSLKVDGIAGPATQIALFNK